MNGGNVTIHPRYRKDAVPAGRTAPRAAPRRPASRTKPQAQPQIRPESLSRSAKARAEANARAKAWTMHVKPGMLFGFTLVLALFFFIVYANMNISTLNRENSEMLDELNALESAEKDLRNQYEGIYNLSEVESFAITEKGMIKPGRDQILYINLAGADEAVLLPRKSFWESLGTFFSAIGTSVMDFLG